MSYKVNQRTGGGNIAEAYLFYQERRVLSDVEYWPLTSFQRALTLIVPEFPGGIDFKTDPGLERDAVESTNETSAAEIKVTVAHDSPVALQWKQQQPEWPIWLKLYRVQLDKGRSVLSYRGEVVNAEFANGMCTLTVTSLKSILARVIPFKTYQDRCNNMLFDQFCTVNRDNFMMNATVVAITDRILTIEYGTGTAVQPIVSGYFTAGYFSKPVGADPGGRGFITLHTELGGGQAELQLIQRASWLVVGDAIKVYAGCSKLLEACRNKFNNPQHFIGFTRIPLVNPYTDGVE